MTLRVWLPLIVAALPVLAPAQDWKDRAEYDLVLEIRAEPDPTKRLALIDQWRKKFPDSSWKQPRLELQLAAHEASGDIVKTAATAREILKSDPRSAVGLYWLTALAPSAGDASAAFATEAADAAKRLLSGPSASLAKDQRAQVELLAHRTLGWAAWQRGAHEEAERELMLCLERDPNRAEFAAWLGTVLALQKTPEKQPAAVWHLARAAAIDGPGALSGAQMRDTRALLDRVYSAYHGDTEGIEQVAATAAKGGVLPPAAFKIETAEAAAARRKDEELERTNPGLFAWIKIRRKLESPDAATNFQAMLNAPLPILKGTLIRCNPAAKPTELVLGIQTPDVEEVVIQLDGPLPSKPTAGAQIEFEATPLSFNSQPFQLTVKAERAKVNGWQGDAPR